MAETWVLNETIYEAGSDDLRFYAGFQCNGERFDEFNAFINSPPFPPSYDILIANHEQNYKTIYSYYDGEAWWLDEAYRTIVLDEPATGDFLTWLQANATKDKAVNKVVDNGIVKLDLTADTVTAEDVKIGITFHDASGDAKTGTAPEPSGNKSITAGTSTQTGIDVSSYATVSVAPTPTESKTATENGDVTPTSGKFLSKVTVNVPATPTQSKTLTLGANAPQTVNPDSGYALSSVPVSLDTSVIKAENIKKDVQMLGITGTHEGGTTPTLITKTVTANGTYNASADDADGYSKIIVAIPVYDGTVV